ncbi:acyl-protein thioesterase 1 [Trichomonascus vanleenenianus]|uniref:palmitoyl-(protein) hydrolase n=1 Tax=Trichomonascus vanleenenianus TaxID=2268995 RepID=UPI003ECAE30D
MSVPAIRIPAAAIPKASVIFLHGLGDSGHGWSFLAEQARRRPSLNHVNFIFPHAPAQPVTLNFGMKMPSWHDITDLDSLRIEDEAGVLRSVGTAEGLIAKEAEDGIPSNKVILGGFSQGAAISLSTSVITDKPLAGVIALSGYLPLHEKLQSLKKDVNKDTPIFMGHGTADDVVKFPYGQRSRDFLKKELGRSDVQWHEYPGLTHSADLEEIEQVLDFIESALK